MVHHGVFEQVKTVQVGDKDSQINHYKYLKLGQTVQYPPGNPMKKIFELKKPRLRQK